MTTNQNTKGNGTVDSLVALVRDRTKSALRERRPANPFA
jgi:hypothetical protein